jgi:hypothetical protein
MEWMYLAQDNRLIPRPFSWDVGYVIINMQLKANFSSDHALITVN